MSSEQIVAIAKERDEAKAALTQAHRGIEDLRAENVHLHLANQGLHHYSWCGHDGQKCMRCVARESESRVETLTKELEEARVEITELRKERADLQVGILELEPRQLSPNMEKALLEATTQIVDERGKKQQCPDDDLTSHGCSSCADEFVGDILRSLVQQIAKRCAEIADEHAPECVGQGCTVVQKNISTEFSLESL